MTSCEQKMIHQLRQCRFLPGSSAKRLIKAMKYQAQSDPKRVLTHQQCKDLGRLYWESRKQLIIKGFSILNKDGLPILERDLASGNTRYAICRICRTAVVGERIYHANYLPPDHDAVTRHVLVIGETEFYFCKAAGAEEISADQMQRDYQREIRIDHRNQLALQWA
jgi:hypothetical protein